MIYLLIFLRLSLRHPYICWTPISELRDLTNVELLDLSRNRFNGSIPVRGQFVSKYACLPF